jgi:hypothetical protein
MRSVSLVPTITFTAAFWDRALTTSSPLDSYLLGH